MTVTSDVDADEKAYFESRGASVGQVDESPPPEDAPAPRAEPPPETVSRETEPEPSGDETETSDVDEHGRKRMVNYGALHAERQQHKQTKRDLEETRALMSRMEERFEQIQKRLTPESKEPEGPVVPNYDEDPEGYVRAKIDRLERLLTDGQTKQQQQTEAQTRQQQFMGRYRANAAEFSEQQPDFMDAYGWLQKNIDAELQVRGFVDPMERARILQSEEVALVERAFRSGRNAAELIYELAGHRGYKPTATQQTDAKPQQSDKLATLSKGQAAARSLSAAGGGETPKKGTLEYLSTLDGDEFDREWEEMRRRGALG